MSDIIHRIHYEPILTDMFMHTNVCTMRGLNLQPAIGEYSDCAKSVVKYLDVAPLIKKGCNSNKSVKKKGP
jgi:hypothetical protein